jgi:hypothetical protein
VSKNHFLTIYRPFSTIYREGRARRNAGFAALAPFSLALAPLKNGENGGNGIR